MDAPLAFLNREKTQILPPDEQMGWTDGRWGLLVSQSPTDVTDVVLKGDELLIGRDPVNAVFISDSRRVFT